MDEGAAGGSDDDADEGAAGESDDAAEEQPDPLGPDVVEAELVDNLPAPLREALHRPGVPPEVIRTTIAAFAASYSGPLPPPDQLRAYNDVLPGAADRILSMAENQQSHRHELELMTVRETTNRSWWGLRLGFVVTVLVVGIGAAAILTGKSLAGFGLILADLAVLAGVFVYGRAQQQKELTEKDEQTKLPDAE